MSELQDRINIELKRPIGFEPDPRELNIVRHYNEVIEKGWMTVSGAFYAAMNDWQGKRTVDDAPVGKYRGGEDWRRKDQRIAARDRNRRIAACG